MRKLRSGRLLFMNHDQCHDEWNVRCVFDNGNLGLICPSSSSAFGNHRNNQLNDVDVHNSIDIDPPAFTGVSL